MNESTEVGKAQSALSHAESVSSVGGGHNEADSARVIEFLKKYRIEIGPSKDSRDVWDDSEKRFLFDEKMTR